MPGDEGRLAAGHGAIGYVQPLHQLRAIDHGHDQFPPVERGADPLGQSVLADGVEGLRQFVPALVDAVAAAVGLVGSAVNDVGTASRSPPTSPSAKDCITRRSTGCRA